MSNPSEEDHAMELDKENDDVAAPSLAQPNRNQAAAANSVHPLNVCHSSVKKKSTMGTQSQLRNGSIKGAKKAAAGRKNWKSIRRRGGEPFDPNFDCPDIAVLLALKANVFSASVIPLVTSGQRDTVILP